MRKILEEEELDKEWLELILEARDLGISIEEVLAFLAKN
ncbi:DNA-binding anti-repressor SinI [Niallia sp. NCCP-28]|nr:DNA-binding anti-repressor SinI [Niallia sp. NCCP-28]